MPKRGRAAIEAMGGEPDSDFEIEVSDRLKQKGYLVDTQIGVSGFKIDLGVRHPDHPELFLAGIECDGASYHSSKSARDRDRLREEVLRGLGWQLLRVWSTDWFDNADSQIEKLDKQLKLMRERPIATFRDYSLKTSYISPINETGGVESEFHSRSNLDDLKVPASWDFYDTYVASHYFRAHGRCRRAAKRQWSAHRSGSSHRADAFS